ncbi:uncharacterized protein TNCV_3218131 [Trichonephila clavipes]|nr:uncharacterized protein TNCV_3218131 [Trichonephila clavipes]
MVFSLLRQVGKSSLRIHNGMLCTVRMCNKDVTRDHSAGQSSQQSKEATYGAPEYYQYNEYSFNDIHKDMEKYRLPRPSSLSQKDKK